MSEVSVQGFLEFARTKNGKYTFGNIRECAFAQYLTSIGINALVGGWDYLNAETRETKRFVDIHPDFHVAVNATGEPSVDRYTWEALTARLEKLV